MAIDFEMTGTTAALVIKACFLTTRTPIILTLASCGLVLMTMTLRSEEYHVAVSGTDANPGSVSKPFKTISAAAEVAQPGDVITVHGGTYREHIDPPRGGESDARRITYRAAVGERVVIKGSERVKGWEKVQNDIWKVTLPNSFFGAFNLFDDVIGGDWFDRSPGPIVPHRCRLSERSLADRGCQTRGRAEILRSGDGFLFSRERPVPAERGLAEGRHRFADAGGWFYGRTGSSNGALLRGR